MILGSFVLRFTYVLTRITQYSFHFALPAHTNICGDWWALAVSQLTMYCVMPDVLKHST
jgi:hypothetical protein